MRFCLCISQFQKKYISILKNIVVITAIKQLIILKTEIVIFRKRGRLPRLRSRLCQSVYVFETNQFITFRS